MIWNFMQEFMDSADSPYCEDPFSFSRYLLDKGKKLSLPVNVLENDRGFTVEAALPGYTRKEVEVTAEDGMLTIKATPEPDVREAGTKMLAKGFVKKGIVQTITLGALIDTSEISASLSEGVLSVKIPKKKEVENKKRILIS